MKREISLSHTVTLGRAETFEMVYEETREPKRFDWIFSNSPFFYFAVLEYLKIADINTIIGGDSDLSFYTPKKAIRLSLPTLGIGQKVSIRIRYGGKIPYKFSKGERYGIFVDLYSGEQDNMDDIIHSLTQDGILNRLS